MLEGDREGCVCTKCVEACRLANLVWLGATSNHLLLVAIMQVYYQASVYDAT